MRKLVRRLESENTKLKETVMSSTANVKAYVVSSNSPNTSAPSRGNTRGIVDSVTKGLAIEGNAGAAMSSMTAQMKDFDVTDSGTGAGVRNLTQKQTLAFIDELYSSKVKYDKKSSEGKLPRETMEQHMYVRERSE